ncbi:MAG: anti-sigma factor family protein [Armatimonadota bacterium]
MKCREIGPLISLHIDGACSDEEAAAVERHLAECRECRTLAAELRRTVQLVSSLPERVTSDAFMPSLSARLREPAPAGLVGWPTRIRQILRGPALRWQIAGLAAAVVLVAGLIMARGVPRAPAPTPNAPAVAHGLAAPEAAGDDFLDAMLDAHRAYAAAAEPVDNAAFTYAAYDANM